MEKLIINELPFERVRGKRVFVRIDTDAEQPSPVIFDEIKLRSSLPTLEYLKHVGARVVIGAHTGQPGGKVVEALRLDPLAERLSQLLSRPVRKLDKAVGPEAQRAVADMRKGDLLLLENLSFYPGELSNDTDFARALAELCDVYCNDAFALADIGLASTVGITHHVRPAVAGRAFARELMMFESLLRKPEPLFAGIVAGARLEEKLPVLKHLLPKLDRLFIGGALAFTFLRAKGKEVGAAPVDEAFIPLVNDLLRKAEKDVEIILPQDFIVVKADQFRAYEESGRKGDVPVWRRVLDTEMLPSDLPVDIGPWSIERIRELLAGASTVFWNGPLGIWEIGPFREGTLEVAKTVIELERRPHRHSMICGDSLSRAIRSFELPYECIRHLTSGGHSALQLLAGKPLAAVEALSSDKELAAPLEAHPRRVLLAVDGSAHSLEAARRLGQIINAEGAELSLIYVQEPERLSTDQTWIGPQRERQRHIEQRFEAERVFALVNAELAHEGLISHRQQMAEGDPAEQILRYADEIGAGLIAMGSHGQTGVLRLLMGSVSRKVADHARCPVLIARIPDEQMARAGFF
jgi:phosphoglycerate kinase